MSRLCPVTAATTCRGAGGRGADIRNQATPTLSSLRGAQGPSPLPATLSSCGPQVPSPAAFLLDYEISFDRVLIKFSPSVNRLAYRQASHTCPAKHRCPREGKQQGGETLTHRPHPSLPGTSYLSWELPAFLSPGPLNKTET